MRHNEFGQPIGDAVPGFTPGERPGHPVLQGRFCRLERLSAARHADDLYAFHGPAAKLQDWTYLPRLPVADSWSDWRRARIPAPSSSSRRAAIRSWVPSR